MLWTFVAALEISKRRQLLVFEIYNVCLVYRSFSELLSFSVFSILLSLMILQITFSILFPGCLLLVYRNTADF